MKNLNRQYQSLNSVFGLMILISIIAILFAGCSDQQSLESLLQQTASELNKSCPRYIDRETRLDNVKFVQKRAILYNYTLVNIEKKEMDINGFKSYFEPTLIEGAKNNPDLAFFREQSVTMIFNYNDKNGINLFTFEITPDKYQN
ncbi:hypothetical protein SDC9_21012 [bioreactor metagenome]|uniref:Uncharacterized protein n=1 Tax=bioreactor metagenome TaxID=1076179 RepID=A0A644U8D4_9ZZZZ|nr:hypothetical protein [Lentimicrobium sp.]MEA5109929.1 hypothetical protein [Lentimicrobium sp.]